MTYTSFARTFDDYGYNQSPVKERPRAQALALSFQKAQAQTGPKTPQRDGQMGGFILDAFFNVAFPGFGVLFGAASLLDMADVYDETRAAFSRSKRPTAQPPQKIAFMFG